MSRGIAFALAVVLGLCAGVAHAQLTGKVTLTGKAPVPKPITAMAAMPQCAAMHKEPVYDDAVIVSGKGELANVVIFLKAETPGELKGVQLDTPATLDQKRCMFVPHVLAVQTEQPVILVCSDPFLHNARSEAVRNKPFNIPQFTVAANPLRPFTEPETFLIKCDVHPWMRAVVRVFDHPYFAVSGDDGRYAIKLKGLKDGTYTVGAWHEVYHDAEPQRVEVKDGNAEREIDFTFKAADSK